MMRRTVRLQVVGFVVLAAVGIAYTGLRYAEVGRVFEWTTYTVELRLAEPGGIYTNAAVTYRGINVGRVDEMRPTREGVVVELAINEDTPAIPAQGLRASVKNLSLVGEYYVNLVPHSESAPYLHEGSVIPAAQADIPVPPAQLVSNVNQLVTSVPLDALRTVVDELHKAFAGVGPELERVLDNTSKLVRTAHEALPETLALIRQATTVLHTQNSQAGNIKSFSQDLRLLSKQLKDSDQDLRRLITTAPQASTEVVGLLRESGPGISRLLADLLTLSRVAAPRTNTLQQLLITYPMLTRAAYSVVPGDGWVHFGLVLNVSNPMPCVNGYEGTPKRSGTETANIPPNGDATCTVPPGSPVNVRGSHNAPHHGVPDAVPAPADEGPRVPENPEQPSAAQSGSDHSPADATDEPAIPLPGPPGQADQPLVDNLVSILK